MMFHNFYQKGGFEHGSPFFVYKKRKMHAPLPKPYPSGRHPVETTVGATDWAETKIERAKDLHRGTLMRRFTLNIDLRIMRSGF